jgi:thiamine pyrophosphate-dependent acetolactate synthase large subunit-like protein
VPSWAIGSDAFQECDTTGITMPVTKHNELVLDPARIPGAVAEAFHIAASGRPGPVLVDVPKDVLQASTAWAWPEELDLPGYRPVARPHAKRVREAAALLQQAARPVLYVGGGVVKADAAETLRELAEAAGAPVTTTLMARGAFPDSHPLALGMPGMHGSYAAVAALQEADLIVALGARWPASPRAPRWSTPTSTPPRSARTARPTCRSSATSSSCWRSCWRPTGRWPPRPAPATPPPGCAPAPTGRTASRSATPSRPTGRSSPSSWSTGSPS